MKKSTVLVLCRSTYLLIASTSCVCMLRYIDTLCVVWTWLRARRRASTRRDRHRLAMCNNRSSFAIPAYMAAYASKSYVKKNSKTKLMMNTQQTHKQTQFSNKFWRSSNIRCRSQDYIVCAHAPRMTPTYMSVQCRVQFSPSHWVVFGIQIF